ncbi:hypothetical protein TSUD_316650 [Trifolium subterraneum]|uniref:Sialate O-acetylesterase domain-containing protein n=1 Tax=Trifolium subterraneum TaxID=3900 RepID=A0A2Z6NYG5_TRISU|nr:hypothetical protein TSUD_316650 [Trifolium subterraneum]
MAGRGGVTNDTKTGVTTWDGVVPLECNPSSSIMKLNGHLKWVEAHEPLHEDIDTLKTNGVGPGMVFANYVLEKNLEFGLVGLVPCAIGGTNISEWEKGKVLYNHMMKRVKASLNDGGSVRALLWFQGESDTVALATGLGPYIEIVRQAQMGIDLLNLKTVDAKGLPLQPDGLHLSTPAQPRKREKGSYPMICLPPYEQLAKPNHYTDAAMLPPP